MKIETVTHKHLRKILEDNYDFVRNDGDISDEDFEMLLYELFYSTLIVPTSSVEGEIFPIIIGDGNGNSFMPLFTDLVEYEKAFANKEDIHPIVSDFDTYMNLGIEGIVINPTCEQFSFSSKAFKDKEKTLRSAYDITDETLDRDELKELLNSKSSLDLSDVYDYDAFFKSLADSVMFTSPDLKNISIGEKGIVEIDGGIPVNSTPEGYLKLFTTKEEMKKGGDRYASVVNLDYFIDFIIRMDFNGLIINPSTEAIVVERNVLLANFDGFRKYYNSSKYAKAADYAFVI